MLLLSPRRPSVPTSQRAPAMPRFVVHEHHARRLHWDLRLEHEGVLVSFAVPKGVPLRPGERRLAVRTPDHALGYIDFEGEIPEGHYGAGTVAIWDRGAYETVEGGPGGHWAVRLGGQRLRGRWALIPFPKAGEGAHLLVRAREPEA
nr:DNA polymerase ligase N-terminal domain-containing protein [Deferrisoma camini]